MQSASGWLRLGTLVASALGVSACINRGRSGELINSGTSSYSPVVSFVASVETSDSVRVSIDRVRVLSPGDVFPGMAAVTGRVEMQALVVTANPAADLSIPASERTSDRNGSRKPWLEVAGSALATLADSLHVGVEQTTGPLRFAIPLAPGTDASKHWLTFRITGTANALPATMADGMAAPVFTMPPIRVFACTVRNLDGKTDKSRQQQMKEMYSSAC
ncbi:MAG: hypothetical protein ACO1Q7_20760 [Gemmatimonas sp.]